MKFKDYVKFKDMEEFFNKRTNYHIGLVTKYANKIADLYPEFDELRDIVKSHDESKFEEPEYTPYIHITWSYHDDNYIIPPDIKPLTTQATEHHVKHNKHHPEYWSPQEGVINPEDRDAPRELIFAQDMPLIYIAEMVADWCAVSEERGTHPKDWADMNIGTRWDFTKDQSGLIYKLINSVFEE